MEGMANIMAKQEMAKALREDGFQSNALHANVDTAQATANSVKPQVIRKQGQVKLGHGKQLMSLSVLGVMTLCLFESIRQQGV